MKNTIYILFVLLVTASSCSKILDVEPTQSISADQAITDKNGLDKAVTGAYNSLQSVGTYGRNQIIVNDLASDNLFWTGTTQEYSQIYNNDIPADNGVVDGIWSANYDGLSRVNNVLYRIDDITGLSTDEYKRYKGEALFLRALFHFNLSTFFGGIPLKTAPTLNLDNINQQRNTIEQVYNQVIADLLLAEELLPAFISVGRASSYSATALLARVYLTQFHQTNNLDAAGYAIAKADKVINEGGFILAPSFADLFNGNTTEPIFEVIYDAQNSNRLAQYFFPRSLAGRYEVAPDAQFIAAFDVLDTIRFQSTLRYDLENKQYGVKYIDITAGTDRVMVLRLAEMYLIRAEARAYTSGDIDFIKSDIDAVRTRAGLPQTEAQDYAALKLAIENERRFEFAFEGHRWADLVRTKRATVVLGIDENSTLFPIPLSEMQTNNLMTQNLGY